MKTLEFVQIEGVLIEPTDLHDFLLTRGTMPRVEGLVEQCEPIVGTHVTVGRVTAGCVGVRGCSWKTYTHCR